MQIITIEVFSWHSFYGGQSEYCIRHWRSMPYRSKCFREAWVEGVLEATKIAQDISQTCGGIILVGKCVVLSALFPNGGAKAEHLAAEETAPAKEC